MPKPFVYKRGQVVTLRATVMDDHDISNPVVDLGGLSMPIPQVHLDAADVRPAGLRDKTDEEVDLARGAEEQAKAKALEDRQRKDAADAKAKADKEAADAASAAKKKADDAAAKAQRDQDAANKRVADDQKKDPQAP